jgi:transposase
MAERHDSSHEKCEKIQVSEPSLMLLFAKLDLSCVEGRADCRYSRRKRRPRLPTIPQFRAHLFKAIRQTESYRKLQSELAENDGLWARVLGFKKPPDHRSFSAFRHRMGAELFVEVFHEIRKRLIELKPDLAKVIAIDSTAVVAYAKPGRGNRKSSDPDASWGVRINPRTGKTEPFFGFKLHTALSAKYGAPLGFRVTSGKRNDSPEYPRIIRMLSSAQVAFDVAVADAGYDARTNYTVTVNHKGKPVIAFNRRRRPKGTTGRPFDRYLPIQRNSPEWKRYYAMRGAVERQFSELKEQLWMKSLTLRGIERVTIHLCTSLIVLLAINLVAHMTGNPELLRSIEPWRYSNV